MVSTFSLRRRVKIFHVHHPRRYAHFRYLRAFYEEILFLAHPPAPFAFNVESLGETRMKGALASHARRENLF